MLRWILETIKEAFTSRLLARIDTPVHRGRDRVSVQLRMKFRSKDQYVAVALVITRDAHYTHLRCPLESWEFGSFVKAAMAIRAAVKAGDTRHLPPEFSVTTGQANRVSLSIRGESGSEDQNILLTVHLRSMQAMEVQPQQYCYLELDEFDFFVESLLAIQAAADFGNGATRALSKSD